MPKYNVEISYTTTVEADDEMDAQEMAVDSHDFGSCSYCVDEMKKQYRFECVIDLPWVAPTRVASSEEEFIENILNEYNHALDGLVDLHKSDIRKGSIECYDEEEEDDKH